MTFKEYIAVMGLSIWIIGLFIGIFLSLPLAIPFIITGLSIILFLILNVGKS